MAIVLNFQGTMASLLFQALVLFCVVGLCRSQGLHVPVITDYSVLNGNDLSEGLAVGTGLGYVTAYDPDGTKVTFTIRGDGRPYFAIDASTGYVSLQKELDFENLNTISMELIVVDGADQESVRDCIISLTDENDEVPVFTDKAMFRTIEENVDVNYTVGQVEVTDADTKNEIINVQCIADTNLTKDACETFELTVVNESNGFWRGYLSLKKKLDYEKRKSYTIRLLANDGLRTVNNDVTIEVRDINDSPPKWKKIAPQIIDEEQIAGSIIVIVTATDQDITLPREIFYELIGSHSDSFRINSTTGAISNAVTLDFDSTSSRKDRPYDIIIKAREIIVLDNHSTILGDDPFTTATMSIQITMRDINDNSPEFFENGQRKTNFVVYIDENIASGQNIPGLQMTVTDRDQNEIYNTFTVDTDVFKDVFRVIPKINSATSSLSIYVLDSKKIDYESGPREYIIRVMAEESLTNPANIGSATVTILVNDVNDETPRFSARNYSVDVSELATGGTPLFRFQAEDIEEGMFGHAGIRYKLFGNIPKLYNIDSITGQLTVNDCLTPGKSPCIDYETRKQYVLTVSATDHNGDQTKGLTRSVPVFVNVLEENDNKPQIDQKYVRYIYEEKTVTINPLLIEAIDPDEKGRPLKFSIRGDSSGLWKIREGESSTGNRFANITAIRAIKYSDAPDQNKGEFVFNVVVSDQISLAFASVIIKIIDINNNAPYFLSDKYRETVSESTTGETSLLRVYARDLDSPTTDNGFIEFAFKEGAVGKFQMKNSRQDDDGTFSVDIFTTKDARFNFESKQKYELVLVARDRGTPKLPPGTADLIIDVTDSNNKIPVIRPTSETINVGEDTQIGTSVHNVFAEDPDTNKILHYFMKPETASQPSGADAVIEFTNMFKINELNGDVTVNDKLNRNDVAFITNALTVEDRGATPLQTGRGALFIRITEYNDQDPKFDELWYNVTLDEEKNRNSFVDNIQCTDEDDTIAEYFIYQVSPRYPNYFTLVPSSGSIIVNERIDFEKIKKITLEATCTDTGKPQRTATSTIVVNINNINDNTPVFNQSFYRASLLEGNRTAEKFLLRVKAEDIDKGDYGIVRYNLSDPDKYFRINEVSGEIYILPNAAFDREKIHSYGLQVIAYDSPNDPSVRRRASVPVYISIIDINDNCPVFNPNNYSAVVPESASRGANIIDILASDADGGIFGRIVFEIQSGSGNPAGSENLFTIENGPSTGRLIAAQNLKDMMGKKSFNVMATDGDPNNPCTNVASVTVDIKESQNDAPEWIFPPRRDSVVRVLESQYRGMLVFQALAEDSNEGPSGVVDYYFYIKNNFVHNTKEFRINRVTGVIRADIVFDREQVDTYFLTLMALDRGNPAASSETTLTIVILDVDDNDPKFPVNKNGLVEPFVLPPLKENVMPTIPLGNCSHLAKDADSDHQNNKIYYRLLTTRKDITDYISVNKNDCQIRLKKPVDYETRTKLEFDILAYNDKNDDSVKRPKRAVNPSILPVVLNIKESNDNKPIFTQQTYLACASTDAPYGHPILVVEAKDLDSSQIIYSMLSGDQYFEIDKNVGTISNLISFQYSGSGKNQYIFQIQAADGNTTTSNKGTANANIFITGSSNLVKLKVNRPRSDVEPFKQQLISTIKDNSHGEIDFACVDSIDNHVTEDGKESTAASDVLLLAARGNVNDGYTIIPATILADYINSMTQEDNNKLAAIYVTRVEENGEKENFLLKEDAILAIFIIAILLIFLAILLLCIGCYCIRNSKKKKTRKLNAQRHIIAQAAPEPVKTSFNPVYSVSPDNPEYATVKKTCGQLAPITPVVIPAPENLEPMPREEPVEPVKTSFNPVYSASPDNPEYATVKKTCDQLAPITPVVIPAPENLEPIPREEPVEDEPVPFIETEVLPDAAPESYPTPVPVIEHPECEDRIETVIMDDDSVGESEPHSEDQPSSLTEFQLPSPPNDGEIEVEMRD